MKWWHVSLATWTYVILAYALSYLVGGAAFSAMMVAGLAAGFCGLMWQMSKDIKRLDD